MIGTFQGLEVTFRSFGQQYTTIDGKRYITFFDLADRKLRGLRVGARVEFEARPAPTVLCHSPLVSEELESAVLLCVEGES